MDFAEGAWSSGGFRHFRWIAICAAAVICLTPAFSAQSVSRLPASSSAEMASIHSAKAALKFLPGDGQDDKSVKFEARSPNYNLFLTGEGAVVMLHHEAGPAGRLERGKKIVVHSYADMLRLRFADSNPPTEIAPVKQPATSGNSNPRMEKDAVARLQAYTAVAYRGIYPGTDVVFRGDERQIALGLQLSPGADPYGVVLEIDGATRITLDAAGDAVLHVGENTLVLEKPSVVEWHSGVPQRLAGGYQIEPNNRIRFLVAPPHSAGRIILD